MSRYSIHRINFELVVIPDADVKATLYEDCTGRAQSLRRALEDLTHQKNVGAASEWLASNVSRMWQSK